MIRCNGLIFREGQSGMELRETSVESESERALCPFIVSLREIHKGFHAKTQWRILSKNILDLVAEFARGRLVLLFFNLCQLLKQFALFPVKLCRSLHRNHNK